jgi:hypothetical protein
MQSYAEALRVRAAVRLPVDARGGTSVPPPSQIQAPPPDLQARLDVPALLRRAGDGVPSASTIPAGAVLLAPRFDGVGKPLAQVPRCWCCAEPWQLDIVTEGKARTYAILKPGCGCLAARCCYRCFVCREHCRCKASVTIGSEQ